MVTQLDKCVIRCDTERDAPFAAPAITTDGFVWIGEGLPQGDPASAILFLAVLEVLKSLLENWRARGYGVLVCTRLTVLGFADDVYVSGAAYVLTPTLMKELSSYLQAIGVVAPTRKAQLGDTHARRCPSGHGSRRTTSSASPGDDRTRAKRRYSIGSAWHGGRSS